MPQNTVSRTDMPCTDFEELIALDAGGDATAEEQARLAEHLADCEPCRQLDRELRQSLVALAEHAPEPDDFELARLRSGVRAQLRDAQRQGRRFGWLAAGVATAAMLLLAISLWWLGVAGTSQGPEEQPTLAERSTPPPTEAGEEAEPYPTPTPEHGTGVELATIPPSPSLDTASDDTAGGEAQVPLGAASSAPSPASTTPVSAESLPPADTGPQANTVVAGAVTENAGGTGPTETLTLKLLSDDPDLVIYWLVDIPTQAEVSTDDPNTLEPTVL